MSSLMGLSSFQFVLFQVDLGTVGTKTGCDEVITA